MILSLLFTLMFLGNVVFAEKIGCLPTEYRCSSGQCVDGGRYCDGNLDCYDGSDEPEMCTNCNRTFYGMTDVKYPLRLSERRSPTCILMFEAAGGRYGDLIEITFLSFQIGTFDLDSTSCLRGYMEVEELSPSSSEKRSSRMARRTKKKGTSRRKENPLKAHSGSFCGSLMGQSATFYSTGGKVKLTIFVPPQGAGQPIVPRLYLTYRFLKRRTEDSFSKFTGESKCDTLITDCHYRNCVIRSPNFPGFYLRNITCHYWIRQDSAPPGKRAHIEIYQVNEFKINIPSGHTNSDRVKRGTLTSDCAGDIIRLFDGRTLEAPLLAEFCGAGPLPAIRSSGPDLLVQLKSAPSQTLSNSHFELSVKIHLEQLSGLFRTAPESCSVTVDGNKHPVGILRSPAHAVPSGTTCTYHIVGKRPTDRIWLYFTSYHMPDLHPYTDKEHCDVGKLEIIYPVPKLRHSHHFYQHQQLLHLVSEQKTNYSKALVESFCEKNSPRQCGHASDYSDLIPSRPCSIPDESYLSVGPEILLNVSFLSSTVIRDNGVPHFTARYEIVETMVSNEDVSSPPCIVTLDSRDSERGILKSPKNVFLFGRGGSKDLVCRYELRGSSNQKIKLKIKDIHFSSTLLCKNMYEPVVQRYKCNILNIGKFAVLNITEIWQNMQFFVGCVCEQTEELIIESVGPAMNIEFLVRDMGPKDDFRTFYFHLEYEFIDSSGACDTLSTLDGQVMSGSRGHMFLSLLEPTPFRCRWLLAAFPKRALYVTVRGRVYDTECRNKILFFNVNNREPHTVYCSTDEEQYESFFTESWRADTAYFYQPDLTFLEFIAEVPGQLKIDWLEVIRPGPNHCPLECPELEACIGADLACDGIRHCPTSGNDETPERCTQFPLYTVVVSSLAAVVVVTIIVLGIIIKIRHISASDKTVIPPPDMYKNNYKRPPPNKSPIR
ncbi:uncharacterized protein [Parasteatoda tepidariorum]|uniref:uncharacterized protein n=1 Tax=Parasteatoda tepidariorum TaxID=114398 RepID=UPI00077F9276|nr:uncharacterized protein LOC107450855 [Parasteatoda tepidariorum]